MKTVQRIALFFSIIGAILWGVVGIFNINFADAFSSDMYTLIRIIYIIVGICGIVNIGLFIDEKEIK
ncbi:MAG: DUF378 domain-containing protein [Bacilli bacterium]